MDPERRGRPLPTIEGTAEGASDAPGCPFAARCERATEICSLAFPEPTSYGAGDHLAWCWNPVTTAGRIDVATGPPEDR
jgi:hypothetical protein